MQREVPVEAGRDQWAARMGALVFEVSRSPVAVFFVGIHNAVARGATHRLALAGPKGLIEADGGPATS